MLLVFPLRCVWKHCVPCLAHLLEARVQSRGAASVVSCWCLHNLPVVVRVSSTALARSTELAAPQRLQQCCTRAQQQCCQRLAPPGVSVVTCTTEVWKAGVGTMRTATLMPLALTSYGTDEPSSSTLVTRMPLPAGGGQQRGGEVVSA